MASTWQCNRFSATIDPHTQHLYTLLPHDIAEVINNIHFRFNNSIEDAFIWTHNKNGIYTTKSGYNWLLSQAELVANFNPFQSWSWIWKLNLPEKYKFLIWLACHNVVPTLSLLRHRNIVPSAICPRCGTHEETILYCVRDCIHSKNIWHRIGFSALDFFSAGVWWAWRHRNLMCLNNEVWSICYWL